LREECPGPVFDTLEEAKVVDEEEVLAAQLLVVRFNLDRKSCYTVILQKKCNYFLAQDASFKKKSC
jgi:hypothetical protein